MFCCKPLTGLNVAVLMGGIGSERDISIQSGNCVASALKQAGLNVVTADIGPDNLSILNDTSIDVFFIALHGQFGEDGQLQQILEDRSLTFTGSGPAASRLAFDKMASKRAFAAAGVETPAAVKLDCQSDIWRVEKRLPLLADKFVVKPVRQGSSIGISIVDDPHKAAGAAQETLKEFGDCLIEEFIHGREVTVGVLVGQALPIIEIRPKTAFYNYHAKYIDEQTEFVFDTIAEPALRANIKTAALDCFNVLGCEDFARVDFVLSAEQIPYALEVNTIPGFTSHSLLPMAAAKVGFSMSDLCVRIVQAALENKKTEKSAVGPAAGQVRIADTSSRAKRAATTVVNQKAKN